MTKDLVFRLDVSVDDKTGKPQAAYLQVRQVDVAQTREVVPGCAFADYAADGQLVGIEFLAPCSVAILDQITVNEPESVKQFFRSTPPRELLVA